MWLTFTDLGTDMSCETAYKLPHQGRSPRAMDGLGCITFHTTQPIDAEVIWDLAKLIQVSDLHDRSQLTPVDTLAAGSHVHRTDRGCRRVA